MDTHILIMGLQSIKGLGNKTIRYLLQIAPTIKSLQSLRKEEVKNNLARKHFDSICSIDWHQVQEKYNKISSYFPIVAFGDNEYPESLVHEEGSPLLFYMRGNILPEDEKAIAIVGTRNATDYGIKQANSFAFELAKQNITIISGLAKGIDVAAHAGALQAKGRTIAVLGNGIDSVYPTYHARIAQQISQSGACISEYEPGISALPHHFPQRNRIVSTLSLGIIVIEAPVKSGAMITAYIGVEQGKQIFAVPGNINNINSAGCHKLIQDGAKLITKIEDILDELPQISKVNKPQVLKLSEIQKKIWQALQNEYLSIDDVVNITGISAQQATSELLRMQMDGIVLCHNRIYSQSPQWIVV